MKDVNGWLMALAFLLGMILTFAMMIRRVTREVPVTLSATPGALAKVEVASRFWMRSTPPAVRFRALIVSTLFTLAPSVP